MNTLEKRLLTLIKTAAPESTPGLQLQVLVKGKKVADVDWGDTFKFYDWASLTKVVATTSLVMEAVDRGVLKLGDSVSDLAPSLDFAIPLRTLLTHTAGLPWWLPVYEELALVEGFEDKRAWLLRKLRSLEAVEPSASLYSDVDLWFLGAVLEAVSGRPLHHQFSDLSQKLGLKKTHFHLGNKPVYSQKLYAPTEDCPWRKRVLQGEVHDENAWAMGGVGPHAGLFGPMEDLAKWCFEIRKARRGESKIWSQNVTKLFTSRAIPEKMGDWALGFMMPSRPKSSAGIHFSPESFGHTGFTGTSVWFDPKKDVIVLILSNRVHPTRKNETFPKILRAQIHNWVMEEISNV